MNMICKNQRETKIRSKTFKFLFNPRREQEILTLHFFVALFLYSSVLVISLTIYKSNYIRVPSYNSPL